MPHYRYKDGIVHKQFWAKVNEGIIIPTTHSVICNTNLFFKTKKEILKFLNLLNTEAVNKAEDGAIKKAKEDEDKRQKKEYVKHKDVDLHIDNKEGIKCTVNPLMVKDQKQNNDWKVVGDSNKTSTDNISKLSKSIFENPILGVIINKDTKKHGNIEIIYNKKKSEIEVSVKDTSGNVTKQIFRSSWKINIHVHIGDEFFKLVDTYNELNKNQQSNKDKKTLNEKSVELYNMVLKDGKAKKLYDEISKKIDLKINENNETKKASLQQTIDNNNIQLFKLVQNIINSQKDNNSKLQWVINQFSNNQKLMCEHDKETLFSRDDLKNYLTTQLSSKEEKQKSQQEDYRAKEIQTLKSLIEACENTDNSSSTNSILIDQSNKAPSSISSRQVAEKQTQSDEQKQIKDLCTYLSKAAELEESQFISRNTIENREKGEYSALAKYISASIEYIEEIQATDDSLTLIGESSVHQ